MKKLIRREMKEIRFVGGRFEQAKGWIEFDVLPELLQYKRILLETASEQWRRKNPDRVRLPKGFEQNVRLAFSEIKEGSAAIPIFRVQEIEEGALELYAPDEIDESAEIIDATFLAAANDAPLPNNLPIAVLDMFEDLGKTLLEGEAIETGPRDRSPIPRFDATTRSRILERARRDYEDLIKIEGEVRAASLKAKGGGSFTLYLDDGSSVEGTFTEEQESDVTEALHRHQSLRVRIEGQGEFTRDGRLRKILNVARLEKHEVGTDRYDPKAEPIWKVLSDLGRSVPDEVWADFPTDASVNLDHYLYGFDKETP